MQRGREGAVPAGAEPRVLRWLETQTLQVLCVRHSPSSQVKIVEKSQLKKKASRFKKKSKSHYITERPSKETLGPWAGVLFSGPQFPCLYLNEGQN